MELLTLHQHQDIFDIFNENEYYIHMIVDKDNNVLTAHTTNPVPFIVINKNIELNEGKLGDIAPTILELMELEKPEEMTGISLIKK